MNFKPVILKPKKGQNPENINIKIRVTHNGEGRDIPTPFYINPVKGEWNYEKSQVSKKHPNANYLNIEITKLKTHYEEKALKKRYVRLADKQSNGIP